MPARLGTGAPVGHGCNRPASGPDVTQTSDIKAAVAHFTSPTKLSLPVAADAILKQPWGAAAPRRGAQYGLV